LGTLPGDTGGGAWIGRTGRETAPRAHDKPPGASARLPARAEAAFVRITGLPHLLRPRADRPAVLASFAPDVAVRAGGSGLPAHRSPGA
jgi:N-acetylglucosamine kinase-like BadF-type ATPase